MRTFSTHLAASMAASGLKWISATIGTSQPRSSKPSLIGCRFFASFTVGAVIRTISQPTATDRASVGCRLPCPSYRRSSSIGYGSDLNRRLRPSLLSPRGFVAAGKTRGWDKSDSWVFWRRRLGRTAEYRLLVIIPGKILNVVKRNVQHESNQKNRARALENFQQFQV